MKLLCSDPQSDSLVFRYAQSEEKYYHMTDVSTDLPKSRQIEILPKFYESTKVNYKIKRVILKGQYAFCIGTTESTKIRNMGAGGVFTIYNLKNNKTVINRFFSIIPEDMHHRGKYLFITTGNRGCGDYDKLVVVNIHYWLTNS